MTHTPQSARRVWLTADDFGLHPDIDRGILELIACGALDAVSVLIHATAFSPARFDALARSPVRIGAHLALTEVSPLSATWPQAWRAPSGAFVPHWRDFAARALTTPLPLRAIDREWRLQLDALNRALAPYNRTIDYLDTHQNLHLVPPLGRVVARIAQTRGPALVRTFYDPLQARQPLHSALAWIARNITLTPALHLPTYGLFDSGQLTPARLASLLRLGHSRGRRFAVMTHPGHPPQAPPAPPAYRLQWHRELRLLLEHRADPPR